MLLDLETQNYCKKIGFDFDKILKINHYIELLLKANESCNLIGRQQDLHRVCHHHVIDCLLPLTFLPEGLTSIYDIGTGAGLPGVLWAIAKPDIYFYLVEKSPKKCLFLTQTISALQLENISVLNKRSDTVTGSASLVVSRAMAAAADLLSQTQQLSTKDTRWWFMKALRESVDRELLEVDLSIWRAQVIPLSHPTQDVTRNLVCITKA